MGKLPRHEAVSPRGRPTSLVAHFHNFEVGRRPLTDLTHTHTHHNKGRERKETDKKVKMTKKAITVMMAVLAACALTSTTAMKAPTAMNTTASVADDSVPPLEDIPTSLSFRAVPSGRRALTWGWRNYASGGEWSWESPWGGMVTGSWGDGGGASGQSTGGGGQPQYCTCGGCSQHIYLQPGNDYCAPSRQWCYFDVQNGAVGCYGARQGAISGRWLRCC